MRTTTQPTTTLRTTSQPTTTSRKTTRFTTQPTTTKRTTTKKPIKNVLHGGECLKAGEFIQSPNKCFKVYYQGDGNFVNYRASTMQALWSSKTPGTCTKFACMQTDGNFVVYDCNMRAKWSSHTNGHPGSRIIIQNEGNLVLYSPNNVALWYTTGSTTHC